MARPAAFATNIPAASSTSSDSCCRSMPPLISRKGSPSRCRRSARSCGRRRCANPDFKMYPHVYNVLALKGQHFPAYFDVLVDPYDKEDAVKKSEAEFSKIKIPTYTGSGWYGYTLQDPSRRRAELVSQHQSAPQEAPAHGPGASRPPVQGVPQRNAALVRPLAQGDRHRNPQRPAGAILGDGRQRMAQRQRLAAAGNAVDQVLSQRLGATDAPIRSSPRAPTITRRPMRSRRCRRARPTASRSCAISASRWPRT